MHTIILYGSYIIFPFIFGLIFWIYKYKEALQEKKFIFFLIILLIFASILFIYARFIERNIIFVKTTRIETGFSAKIVVISDIHLGIYKNSNFLQRIVKKINKIPDADALLIPGDFTYYPPNDLETLFSPLKEIKIPIYAVLGNHDSERPGPPIQKKLEEALKNNWVIFLHNTDNVIKNTDINILWLGDNWAWEDDIDLINNYNSNDKLIVITHNPDTSLFYYNNIPDITISWHSHGGQIRLPFIYHSFIPCKGDFDQWLYDTDFGKVFVSAWVGEVWLPMRLAVPPTIEILELY